MAGDSKLTTVGKGAEAIFEFWKNVLENTGETFENLSKEKLTKGLEKFGKRCKELVKTLEEKGREKMYRCQDPEAGSVKRAVEKAKPESLESKIWRKEDASAKEVEGKVKRVGNIKEAVKEHIDITETLRITKEQFQDLKPKGQKQ